MPDVSDRYIENKPDFARLHELMLHLHAIMSDVEDLGNLSPTAPKQDAVSHIAEIIDTSINGLRKFADSILFK